MHSAATAGGRAGAYRNGIIGGMLTLYDAARCPYCARARIMLAEKGLPYDVHEIDLDDRPAWLYAKNDTGRVPVIEEDGGLCLPESHVIMEYLEERYPEPPLMPADPAGRAQVRLLFERFGDFSDEYYDLRMDRGGTPEKVHAQLAKIDAILAGRSYLAGAEYGLADIGYVPWVLRCESQLGLDVRGTHPHVADWLSRLEERPAIAAEVEVLAAL
jgi:RNA polymerase-associated protein